MKNVHPDIHIIAATTLIPVAYDGFLRDIGAGDWESDAEDNGEALIETAGRTCYKAFGIELNRNLTKTREGNHNYIGNILSQQHGSVLEHSSVTVAMTNVSRIFTHELVRHRQGTAFSQESMRFVRLDNIPIWVPDLTETWHELGTILGRHESYPELMQTAFRNAVTEVTTLAERHIASFSHELDQQGVPFHIKKKITSALRRMAPSGHATNIIITANHRAWRFMIEQRTNAAAEEEIRTVFSSVAFEFQTRYPAIYQDMSQQEDGSWTFKNHKV